MLARLNALPPGEAAEKYSPVAGSRVWAAQLAAKRPFADEQIYLPRLTTAGNIFPRPDSARRFRSHPRIGEKHAQAETTSASAAWSKVGEQSQMKEADAAILLRMQEGHRAYEDALGASLSSAPAASSRWKCCASWSAA